MEKEKVLEIEFKEVWDDKWAWKITKNNLDFKNTGGEIVSEDIKILELDKFWAKVRAGEIGENE